MSLDRMPWLIPGSWRSDLLQEISLVVGDFVREKGGLRFTTLKHRQLANELAMRIHRRIYDYTARHPYLTERDILETLYLAELHADEIWAGSLGSSLVNF